MKKIFFCCAAVFSCVFISCGRKKSAAKDDGLLTLKEQLQQKIGDSVWAEELEKDRLSLDIGSLPSVASPVVLTPAVFNNSEYAKQFFPVYPYYEGFASLDLSHILPEIKLLVEEFCAKLSKGGDVDAYFEDGSLYELSLFYRDLRDLWSGVFNSPFPEKPSENYVEEKADSETEQNPPDNYRLFSKYMLGSPFQTDDSCEIPVRLTAENAGFVDVMLFLTKSETHWKIDQIHILKAERT